MRGRDGTYAWRYVRKPLDWRGKSKMGFASKLIGQPILFYSEGTVYEMQLDVGSHKVKCITNQK